MKRISGYCEQLHAHKFNNLDEMDQILERKSAKTHTRNRQP